MSLCDDLYHVLMHLRQPLAGQYPRGHKELRGSFFRTYGPKDTVAWFAQRGVSLKVIRSLLHHLSGLHGPAFS